MGKQRGDGSARPQSTLRIRPGTRRQIGFMIRDDMLSCCLCHKIQKCVRHLLLALTCSMPAYDVQPTITCNRLFTRSESAPFYHDNHKNFRIGLGVGGIDHLCYQQNQLSPPFDSLS